MTDLSEREKWDAVLRGDEAFDGVFLWGQDHGRFL